MTNEIVELRLKEDDCKKGYLLDGFPRNIGQAEALEKMDAPDKVINLDVDLKALADRLTGRRVCAKCGESYHISTKKDNVCTRCGGELIQRADDTLETVNKRLTVYEQSTAPLIDYYEKKGKLVHIDGMKSIDEVFAEIEKALR